MLEAPATKERYAGIGTVLEVSDKPADFAKLIASDLDWMNATAKANNIKLE